MQTLGTLYQRLHQGFSKTRAKFSKHLGDFFLGEAKIDEECFETLEALLISADVGASLSMEIIKRLEKQVDRQDIDKFKVLIAMLHEVLLGYLNESKSTLSFEDKLKANQGCSIVLFVGVNGAGKTTTIGKLSNTLVTKGQSVLLAAGDTYRAAAIEQLQAWGKRNDVPVVSQQQGSDSAAVIFDALESAKAKSIDVVLADTAGRLHDKQNLMMELEKIVRVLKRFDENAPHEIILVLDGTMGQNLINQVQEFQAVANVTGLVITKLDGTSKGGILVALAQKFKVPIYYIGIGEDLDSLCLFEPEQIVKAILGDEYK